MPGKREYEAAFDMFKQLIDDMNKLEATYGKFEPV